MKSKEFLAELRDKSCAELQDEARQISDELMKLSFRRAVGREEGSHQRKELHKKLARVFTVLTAKQKTVTE